MNIPKLNEITITKRDEAQILSWPVTAAITSIDTRANSISFPYTKAGLWPVCPWPWAEPPGQPPTQLDGNLWSVVYIGGRGWVAATVHWLRPGQTVKALSPADFPYDYGLPDGTPLVKDGDLIGFFVSTPARLETRGPVRERTAIVWTRYGTTEVVGVEDKGPIVEPLPTPPPTPSTGPTLHDLEARLVAVQADLDSLQGDLYEARVELAKVLQAAAAMASQLKQASWRGDFKILGMKGVIHLKPESVDA